MSKTLVLKCRVCGRWTGRHLLSELRACRMRQVGRVHLQQRERLSRELGRVADASTAEARAGAETERAKIAERDGVDSTAASLTEPRGMEPRRLG